MGPEPGELLFAAIIVVFTVSMVYAGFKQWLTHRSGTREVGDIAVMQEALEEAAEEREALKRRIQHLEAIAAEDDFGSSSDLSSIDADLDSDVSDAERSSGSARSGPSRTRS